MRPQPTIPSVAPARSAPRSWAGCHGPPAALAHARRALGHDRRATREQQRDREVGGGVGQHVRACCRPRCRASRAASRSMLSVPTAMFAIARSRGQRVEQLRVDAVGEHGQQRVRAGRALAQLGRRRRAGSPGHTSTSCAARSRSSASNGSARVTNTRAIAGHSAAMCTRSASAARDGTTPTGASGCTRRAAGAALARALRDPVRHRRGQLDLLPAREPGRRSRAGSSDTAGGLRVRGQGEPVPDAHEAADATCEHGDRALLRGDRAARRLAQARPGPLAAARAHRARRAAARAGARRDPRGRPAGAPLLRVPPSELVHRRRCSTCCAGTASRWRSATTRSGRGSRG